MQAQDYWAVPAEGQAVPVPGQAVRAQDCSAEPESGPERPVQVPDCWAQQE